MAKPFPKITPQERLKRMKEKHPTFGEFFYLEKAIDSDTLSDAVKHGLLDCVEEAAIWKMSGSPSIEVTTFGSFRHAAIISVQREVTYVGTDERWRMTRKSEFYTNFFE